MSHLIDNPKGGKVIKAPGFDRYKNSFDFRTFYYVREFNIKIPDFDFNEFLIERLKEEPNFNFADYLQATFFIERRLLTIYNIYKKNPVDYDQLYEIEQRIDKELFFTEITAIDSCELIYREPNFNRLKKIWVRYINFPKLTNISLNTFFLQIEKIGKNLETLLRKRNIIINFLKPHFSYPIKRIPPVATIVEEITPVEKPTVVEITPVKITTVDKSTQTIIDLKSPSDYKMSTIKNPRGGKVLKVPGFDKFKKLRSNYGLKNVTDFELNEFIAGEINKEPGFNYEDYLKLKEMHGWVLNNGIQMPI